MSKDKAEELYTLEETVARAEAALKRMLSTPHKPHKPIGKNKPGLGKSNPKGAKRAT